MHKADARNRRIQAAARWTALLATAILSACAGTPSAKVLRVDPGQQACAEWLGRLDTAVADAGVTDAQDTRIAGHPHLRTDRYTAVLAQDPRIDDVAFGRDTMPAMRALDRAARTAEIGNLPLATLEALGATRAEAGLRAEECANRLMQGPRPPRAAILVPDDYSTRQRVLGAYILAREAFTLGVQRQLEAVSETFAKPLVVPPGAKVLRYAPAVVPAVSPDAETLLLDRHQPIFEKVVASDDDLAGALVWDAALGRPVVVADQPALYRQLVYTRYRGQTLTQLVYTLWFVARPADGPGDLLAGHLDGIMWRVTLDASGRPLIYDTAHPCGCYHYFIPTPRATPLPAPADEPEWAFVPQSLGTVGASDRVVLRIASRTSYLQRVSLEPTSSAVDGAVILQSLPQTQLRSLPVRPASTGPDGAALTRSAYGPDGLVPGSERAERFYFWPMGIASAGQMRQWGRHATAFVGRRHFDDADLFEKRFVFSLDD